MSIRANIAKRFMTILRNSLKGHFDDIHALRKEKEKWFARLLPPRSVRFEETTVLGLKAQWCYPPEGKEKHTNKVLYFIHGGGFASCSMHSHWGIIGKFALELGIKVFGVNYRLAPEHPFPAALDDVLHTYQWLLESYKPEDIIVMGDSAGGGLSLSLLLKLRALGLPQPLTAVLLSPWTDMTLSGASIKTKEAVEPLLPVFMVERWAKWYVGDSDPRNPLISPIYADLSNLPPILVHVGTDEILLDDSTRLQTNAANTNTDLTLAVWDEMFHVWHTSWRFVPEGKQALMDVVQYINNRIEEKNP